MNRPMDAYTLPSIDHMNSPQKRALILRDQLRWMDTKHLEGFLVGVEDPEPPNYKVINGKLHPPFAEVTLGEDAARLDLGNVKFTEGGREWVSRAHFVIEQGRCEMRESEALPEAEDNLDSVPVHSFVAKQMISLFMKKYEAIDTRKRSLNELRQVARNALNQQKIRISPGKTLEKLNLETNVEERSVKGKEMQKRALGDPIPKHVANKRQRIGLDEIPDTAKSVIFNSIPEQVKIDLFNNIVKTALPNFDNLMTAAWNVVYIHKNVGSEDRELYKAISTLEKILVDFTSFHRKAKTKTEIQDKIPREQISAPNTNQQVSSRNTSSSDLGRSGTDSSDHRPHPTSAQSIPNDEKSTDEDLSQNDAHKRVEATRPGRVMTDREHRARPNPSQRLQEPQESTEFRCVQKLREQLANAEPYPSNGGTIQRSQESSPRRTVMDDGSCYYNNTQSQRMHDTSREQQQRASNIQREQTDTFHDPRKNQLQDRQYSPALQKYNRPAGKPAREPAGEMIRETIREREPVREPRQHIYTDGIDEYFEDTEQDAYAADMEEMAPPTQPVFLGNSKLGAPKVPTNATGSAPVAPMMHIRKEGGGERQNRAMS